MITFGAPLALAGGAALAAIVTALHFLSPRPPEPAPLPTARFLRPVARDRVRWHRRPADGGVLLLRVAVAVLLGALFASPRWTAGLEPGSTRIVLLDGGTGMADRWASAVAVAQERATGATEVRGVVFDISGWSAVSAAEWSALPAPRLEGGAASDTAGYLLPARSTVRDGSYLVALRALRATAAEVSTTEIEAELVTHARWGAWDAALGALRPVAWPGRIRLVPVPAPDPATTAPARPEAEGAAPDPVGPAARRTAATPSHVVAALEALGYEVAGERGGLRIVDGTDRALATAFDAAARGDTVVVVGTTADASVDPVLADLWDAGGWPAGDMGGAIHAGTRTLDVEGDTEVLLSGRATGGRGGRALAVVAADGRPLASAAPHGEGCVVRYGAHLVAGARDPDFPHLVRTLADGCRPDPPSVDPTPLDRAALTALEGGGADRVSTAAVRAGAGTPIEGWLLLALALAAAAETLLVARLRALR